jgi:hypothetical protein
MPFFQPRLNNTLSLERRKIIVTAPSCSLFFSLTRKLVLFDRLYKLDKRKVSHHE